MGPNTDFIQIMTEMGTALTWGFLLTLVGGSLLLFTLGRKRWRLVSQEMEDFITMRGEPVAERISTSRRTTSMYTERTTSKRLRGNQPLDRTMLVRNLGGNVRVFRGRGRRSRGVNPNPHTLVAVNGHEVKTAPHGGGGQIHTYDLNDVFSIV